MPWALAGAKSSSNAIGSTAARGSVMGQTPQNVSLLYVACSTVCPGSINSKYASVVPTKYIFRRSRLAARHGGQSRRDAS
jgi:hypothetical protein